jgi:hypothetical protein
MSILKKTAEDGSDNETPSVEIEPPRSSKQKQTSVSPRLYAPKTIAEDSEQRDSISHAETDKAARKILYCCVAVIALSYGFQFYATWRGAPIDSPALNSSFDAIKYFATTIMGYLFGKGSLSNKNK